MYSKEQRKAALDLLVRNGMAFVKTAVELGYPSRQTLYDWYRESLNADIGTGTRDKWSHFTREKKRHAVGHYLQNGKNLSKTVREIGYSSVSGLIKWIDEIAPGTRQQRGSQLKCAEELKRGSVQSLQKKSASTIAGEIGVGATSIGNWKRRLLGKEAKRVMPDIKNEQLPDDVKSLKVMTESLEKEISHPKMETAIWQGAAELVKKDPGINPTSLTNKEKAILVDALKDKYSLCELLEYLGLARSSYFYQVSVLAAPDKHEGLREEVIRGFADSDGVYGYRRIHGRVTRNDRVIASGKVIRRIMKEEGLIVLHKQVRYNSYKGDVSPEVESLVNRDFHAEAPNELWLTGLTGFHIPAGKVYPSPMPGCLDGMPVSWTIGASPNADLVNTMLDLAVDTLEEDERPAAHSDQGCHCRWPGWIEKMDSAKLIRSMPKKGCSPDNSACEGLFGRIKNEFSYLRSWKGVSIEEFISRLSNYLHWYNEKRIKKSLGYLSPVEYRQSLGLAA